VIHVWNAIKNSLKVYHVGEMAKKISSAGTWTIQKTLVFLRSWRLSSCKPTGKWLIPVQLGYIYTYLYTSYSKRLIDGYSHSFNSSIPFYTTYYPPFAAMSSGWKGFTSTSKFCNWTWLRLTQSIIVYPHGSSKTTSSVHYQQQIGEIVVA